MEITSDLAYCKIGLIGCWCCDQSGLQELFKIAAMDRPQDVDGSVTNIRGNAISDHYCRTQHTDARGYRTSHNRAHTQPACGNFFPKPPNMTHLRVQHNQFSLHIPSIHIPPQSPSILCVCSDHPTVNVLERRRSRLVGKSVHL
jgi:hypothetical protein